MIVNGKEIIGGEVAEPETRPSNKEIGRWLDGGAVIINGEKVTRETEVFEDKDIYQIILFPGNKRRTYYYRDNMTPEEESKFLQYQNIEIEFQPIGDYQ